MLLIIPRAQELLPHSNHPCEDLPSGLKLRSLLACKYALFLLFAEAIQMPHAPVKALYLSFSLPKHVFLPAKSSR